MNNFWSKIPKPMFVMAPLSDVTDCVFRDLIALKSRHGEEGGGPAVFYTEFVAADGLAHPVAKDRLMIDLKYGEREMPVIAQIFSGKPENMKKAAALARELGFDGVDINMGCPDKKVEKQGAGSGLIKDPEHAVRIVEATREGAGDIPVSVKTRIGYNDISYEWIQTLLSLKLPALAVHMRTRKEMSDVPAHWELMPDLVALRDSISPETVLIGNGDIWSMEEGKEKVRTSGCDGAMIGRGIFGNPWFFDEHKTEVTVEEKLDTLMEHTYQYEKVLGTFKNFAVMKKHYKAYVTGFPDAKELRVLLMDCNTASEIEKEINIFKEKNPHLLSAVI
ncbi:MAG: nifR3 family TIM-barrel protein [Flavobacteriaceae bacterium]|jgi:nifR3 family TIM-barrel protein